jgi:hypothetical protein
LLWKPAGEFGDIYISGNMVSLTVSGVSVANLYLIKDAYKFPFEEFYFNLVGVPLAEIGLLWLSYDPDV